MDDAARPLDADVAIQVRRAVHELNNMLHVIIGMSSLLADDLADQPDKLELVTMISDAGRRSHELAAQVSAVIAGS